MNEAAEAYPWREVVTEVVVPPERTRALLKAIREWEDRRKRDMETPLFGDGPQRG